MKKLLTYLNLLAVLIVFYTGFNLFAMPLVATVAWGENYKNLMYKCDNAMREHYIAKKSVEFSVSDEAIKNLRSAEMGLLECHEYDKMRKKLQSWGVTKNELASLGLEALEEKAYELGKFIEVHEFRY